VSTSSLFENYTRVASVPVDLNLCGVAMSDDESNAREMAETAPDDEVATILTSPREHDEEETEQPSVKIALTSSVRTQPAQSALVDGDVEEATNGEGQGRTMVADAYADDHREARSTRKDKQTKTVKTQDRSNCVLDMAMVTENDLDKAIKQLKREVEEAAASGVANAAILAMETIQRTPSGRARPRKVKNNASYELAQQFEVDERNFQRKLKENDEGRDPIEKKRVSNNASYELAQQCDYIKALQNSRAAAFQRMDACDELEEAAVSSGRSSGLKMIDAMHEMDSSANEDSYARSQVKQNDSFFGQIKKNSDPFSACGDASVLDPRLLEDEVDYPCLETKPIGASCSEDNKIVVQREKIQSSELESVLENSATKVPHIEKESLRNYKSESEDAAKGFIGESHPERGAQLPESPVAMTLTEKDLEESHGPGERAAGEPLWRVVVEKQTAKQAKDQKRLALEVADKKEEEAKKKEVGRGDVGTGECAPPVVPGSLGERGSGKSAVAVAAVDTNHRGGDHDARLARLAEKKRASSIGGSGNEEDAAGIARKESAKVRAASSPSSSSSSSSSSTMKNEERKKGGLGGFLQRFSRLRFSGRTKVPRSEVQKKTVEAKTLEPQQQQPAAAKKKEPDYIIIPLHPPEEERRRQQEVVTLEEAARRNNVDVQRSASSVR